MEKHEKLSEKFVGEYKEDRCKDLPPCPPVETELVSDGVTGLYPQVANASEVCGWQEKYDARVQAQARVGSSLKFAAGWDRIFGCASTAKIMEKPNPSSEWTVEERLEVIRWIAYQMSKRRLLDASQTSDYSRRLSGVTQASASDLEVDRSRIIDGQHS